MSQAVSKQRKGIKRKSLSNDSNFTVNEFHVNILHFLIENLIPFDTINNPSFRKFLCHFSTNPVSFPDVETLLHLASQLHNDYQNYFREYFSRNDDLSVSLTCHSFEFMNQYEPYMFMSVHYVDSKYRACEIPLTVFNFNAENLSNLIVKNTFLNDYKGKLNFITSNHRFSERCLDVFKFVINEPENDISSKVLPCIPSFLNTEFGILLDRLKKAFEFEARVSLNPHTIISTEDVIPQLTQNFLGPIYVNFRKIQTTNLVPCETDKDGVYLEILRNAQKDNSKGISLVYLNSCLVYKEAIVRAGETDVNEFEWELVHFLVEFNRIVYEVVIQGCKGLHPTSHMTLKWLKILIIKLTAFHQTLNEFPLIEQRVFAPMKEFLNSVIKLHAETENKFDFVLSSYLHPSTKRLLKDRDVTKIVSHVNSLAKTEDAKSSPLDVKVESNDIEELILKTFNCLGSSTECYNYESFAGSDMQYAKDASYLAKESGPYILHFWRRNKKKYPTLSSLSRPRLSIQVCSDRKYEPFKRAFDQLSSSIHGTSTSPCKLQELFILNRLSQRYDLASFDPKNYELDIENFRIEDQAHDVDTSAMDTSFFDTSDPEIAEINRPK